MTENKIIIPIWKKSNLTVEEAAAYCGIGSRKLREMSDSEFCPFVLWNGSKRLIKRRKLDKYIDKQFRIQEETMATKRKDKSRVVLKTGEVQRKDGTYQFSWQDSQMKRRFVYARTLDDLREKEKRIQKDKCDGIKTEARYTTIDELFDLWANMKRGLKNNTFENYKYMYNTFVRPVIGSKRISTLKKQDIKKYYNYLVDERNLKPSTIDNIHTVLHQVLQIAVYDDFIRNNPSDNVLRELKKAHCFQSEKRRALTKPEQELFLNFLTPPVYEHWYPCLLYTSPSPRDS